MKSTAETPSRWDCEVDEPPFYSIKMLPRILKTQGGARRIERAKVLDVAGDPIPRLYSAGEFGSLFHRFYLGAGNIIECLVYGRIAGQMAASQSAVNPN